MPRSPHHHVPATASPSISPSEKDAAIIDTNNSSIVSKGSVECLYSVDPDHNFLQYFVKTPQRCTPVVNRGYWLRMQAVQHIANYFLQEALPAPKKKVVVNLGCGYDTLPFQCLSKGLAATEDVIYVDIDYPDLILIKAGVVAQTPELHGNLTAAEYHQTPVDHVHFRSNQYLALGCDLRDLNTLQRLFKEHGLLDAAVLFIAEVSLTYVDCDSVDALVQWAASLSDARFCTLEQILPAGPVHPFARTMLRHFDSANTPLKSASKYPQLTDQVQRYSSRGWKSVDACDLLAFWANRVTDIERRRVASVEVFDEFEEFYTYAQHYFILYAHNKGGTVLGPFYGPGITWVAGGDYARFPSIRTGYPAEICMAEPGLCAEFTASSTMKRRFGAAAETGPDTVAYHGGQGQAYTARMSTSICITHTDEGVGIIKETSPGTRMCHTMTTLGNGKVLLVGGRTSADKPMKDSWLLEDGVWRRVDDMPIARCRHAATPVDADNVLVYGGRGEADIVLGDWLLWSEDKGWRMIPVVGASTPPARFSTGLCWTDRGFGALCGGLDADGLGVLEDLWRLELHVDGETGKETIKAFWSMVNVLSGRNLWKRFGGQMCYAGYGRILYVGGISGLGLMKSEHEILEIDCTKVTVRAVPSGFPADISPFLIGHSVVCLEDRIVICGGGGMCFDFGACMNNGLWTLGDTERFDSWKFIEEGKGADHSPRDLDTPMPDTPDPETFSETPGPAPVSREVKTATITTAVEFESIIEAGEPVVLQGLDLGPCTTNWTPDYLKATVSPGRNVTVLAANSLHTFRPKSPRSQTMPFPDFIDAVFNTPDFRLHLRSISSTNPSPAPASFPQDFPNLSKDFHLPPALLPAKLHQHSTPLRISSTGVNTWLHYDNMASITCHMVGEKLIRLYPPSDVTRLSFPHGSATSSIPDIFLRPSSPAGTSPYTATLAPGDVLFIPPLWLHAVKPLTPSVAVMVFFRNLEGDAYAHGRDVYANRDLAAYEKGRRKVQGIVQDFALLPVELRRFYIGRLVEELREGMEE